MEMTKTPNRIHPLIAGAAASVILVSLAGTAAIIGLLPNSHATSVEASRVASQNLPSSSFVQTAQPAYVVAPVQPQAETARALPRHRVIRQPQYSQNVRHDTPVYAQPAPAVNNSPIGIGIGAVVGGVLGNHVGNGNGKTLATIAGAVGGGYVGNEIAKRYP